MTDTHGCQFWSHYSLTILDYSYTIGKMAKQKDAFALSTLEHLLIKTIAVLGERAYGVSIYERAQRLAHPMSIKFGSLYPTLDRLERRGLLTSTFADPTPERGGKAKRFFKLTAAGQAALNAADLLANRIVGGLVELV
jgi:DNA-binding PadR family transcriptional regulator